MAHMNDNTQTGNRTPLLKVDNLKTHFPMSGGLFNRDIGAVKAVDGVSFEIGSGEVFGLVGESGSGKSTLGRSILQLIQPTSGHVYYQGRDLVPLTENEMRPLRRDLGLIFQDPHASLNPAMTIVDGVGHPLRIHGMAKNGADMRRQVAEMLERVGLSPAKDFLDRYPDEISGGQKQRLVIARALITRPKLVVADEPVAALDMSVRARVLELMLELKEEFGLTYIFITHDLATARFICDRIGILYLGNFVEAGPADEMFDDAYHPYTRALLSAIPLPDVSRRNRDKMLPRGEIPDASRPPAGCRFHPRCPEAFGLCGWQGHDLIEALEERWTQVDAATFEREQALVGSLDKANVKRESVHFPSSHADELADWLRQIGPDLPSAVFTGITDINKKGDGVTVHFRAAPEPDTQIIGQRHVACHLHGVTLRADGDHVGQPDAEQLRKARVPQPNWLKVQGQR